MCINTTFSKMLKKAYIFGQVFFLILLNSLKFKKRSTFLVKFLFLKSTSEFIMQICIDISKLFKSSTFSCKNCSVHSAEIFPGKVNVLAHFIIFWLFAFIDRSRTSDRWQARNFVGWHKNGFLAIWFCVSSCWL